MAKIDLVVFDFDGTLVDTAPDLVRSVNMFMRDKGFELLPEWKIREEIGMGLRQLILDLYPKHELTDGEKVRIQNDFTAIYETQYLKSPKLFPGVYEFLTEFEGQIAIVSNKRERFMHPILKALGLEAFPWCKIVGGDTFPNMKPHPEPFLAAIEAAGVTPEETLVVGDGEPDVEGALNIGSRMLAVEFGYTPYEQLIDLGAFASLPSFEELLPMVQSMT